MAESEGDWSDERVDRFVQAQLEHVPDLLLRYWATVTAPMEPASLAARDGPQPFGGLPWTFASSTWSAGAGNVLSWRDMVRSDVFRETAQCVLARAALECGVTSRWLTDPQVTSHERRRRAALMQIDDHRERANWEDDWVIDHKLGRPPPVFRARDLQDHEPDRAIAAGLIVRRPDGSIERPLGYTDRVTRYAPESWSYRVLSAFTHGRPWRVVLLTVLDKLPVTGVPDTSLAQTASNPLLTATVAVRVVEVLTTALSELEAYRTFPAGPDPSPFGTRRACA